FHHHPVHFTDPHITTCPTDFIASRRFTFNQGIDVAVLGRLWKIVLVKLWKWEPENLPSVVHSIRTAIAATISLAVARLFGLPEAYWAAIATLVVMQSTLGATLLISVERIAATALGALAGAFLAT